MTAGSPPRLLDALADRLARTPPLRLLALLTLAAVLLNGLWVIPNFDVSLQISRHLDTGVRHYVMYSLLGPVLGALTGARHSLLLFALLHLVILLAGLAGLTRAVERRSGADAARAVVILFFATSLPHGLFTWIGYDILSFVLTTFLVLVRGRPLPTLLLGLLLGVNHFYQGVFVLGALGLWAWADPARARGGLWRTLWPLALGLAAGWAGVLGYLHLQGLHDIPGRVDYNREVTAGRFVVSLLNNPALAAFTAFSAAWLAVAHLWSRYRGTRVPLAFALLLLADGLAMARLTDHTRILSLLLWPFLLAWALHDLSPAAAPDPARRRGLAVLLVLAVLVPKVAVWEGGVHGSVTLYSFDALWHAVAPKAPTLINYQDPLYLYQPFR